MNKLFYRIARREVHKAKEEYKKMKKDNAYDLTLPMPRDIFFYKIEKYDNAQKAMKEKLYKAIKKAWYYRIRLNDKVL